LHSVKPVTAPHVPAGHFSHRAPLVAENIPGPHGSQIPWSPVAFSINFATVGMTVGFTLANEFVENVLGHAMGFDESNA
jgi:hypothetical protein